MFNCTLHFPVGHWNANWMKDPQNAVKNLFTEEVLSLKMYRFYHPNINIPFNFNVVNFKKVPSVCLIKLHFQFCCIVNLFTQNFMIITKNEFYDIHALFFIEKALFFVRSILVEKSIKLGLPFYDRYWYCCKLLFNIWMVLYDNYSAIHTKLPKIPHNKRHILYIRVGKLR